MRTHLIFVAILRMALVPVLALTVVVSASTSATGNITYNLVSPTNGYTVTGTVTTNGQIGLLTTSDIVEWSFMVTAPNGRFFTANSSETDARIGMRGATASATEIVVAYPPDVHPYQCDFDFFVGTGQTWALPWKSLNYLTGYSPAGVEGPTAKYSDYIQGFDKHAETNNLYISFDQRNSYWSQPPATPFVVATVVPEPATLSLLALGGLVALRRRR